jgi:hypothetical protein
MGLAASQVRLLSLTSRQHAIEYEAQRLQAQKLQLANESDAVYNEYLDALDATKIQYKVVENDGSTNYNDATFAKLKDAGFMFHVGNTFTNDYATVKTALGTDEGVNITAQDSYTVLTTLVSEGYVVVMQQKSDPDSGYEWTGTQVKDVDNDALYNPEAIDPETGEAYIYHIFEEVSVSSSTKIQEVSDEVGLKKAEAQYEADMNRINAKDTRYDNELSQLETERSAIKDEIETLETVAKDNVERTFKLFS